MPNQVCNPLSLDCMQSVAALYSAQRERLKPARFYISVDLKPAIDDTETRHYTQATETVTANREQGLQVTS